MNAKGWRRMQFLPDSFRCAVCGRMSENHRSDAWPYPVVEGKEHSVAKMGREFWAELLRRRVGSGRWSCAKYGGICPENNHCPALEGPRGGDFGWGECIHLRESKAPVEVEA